MNAIYRAAFLTDAPRLLEIRRRAILTIAPSYLSATDATKWADALTLSGMETKLRDLEIWVAHLNELVVGWSAIRADKLEGLYIEPVFKGRGFATALLELCENVMLRRGVRTAYTDASANAEHFYRNRGYQSHGANLENGAIPMRKMLQPKA